MHSSQRHTILPLTSKVIFTLTLIVFTLCGSSQAQDNRAPNTIDVAQKSTADA